MDEGSSLLLSQATLYDGILCGTGRPDLHTDPFDRDASRLLLSIPPSAMSDICSPVRLPAAAVRGIQRRNSADVERRRRARCRGIPKFTRSTILRNPKRVLPRDGPTWPVWNCLDGGHQFDG